MEGKKGNTQSPAEVFTKLMQKFLHDLGKSKDRRKKSIHRVRVDMKNIRNLLSVLSAHCPADRFEKMWEDLYHVAGKLRTKHIEMDLLSAMQHKGAAIYKKYSLKKAKKHAQRFVHTLKRFPKKEFMVLVESCASGLRSMPPEKFGRILKLQYGHAMREVQRRWKSPQRKQNLHEIRKKLKLVKFILETAEHLPFDLLPVDQMHAITHAEKMLGDWHDRQKLHDSLIRYVRKHNENAAALRRLAASLKSQNTRAYSGEIRKSMDALIKTAFGTPRSAHAKR